MAEKKDDEKPFKGILADYAGASMSYVPWPDPPQVSTKAGGKVVEPFVLGKSYFLQADTGHHLYVGKVTGLTTDFVKLDKMSWVKSRGDMGLFFSLKTFDSKKHTDKGSTSLPEYVYVGSGCIRKDKVIFFTDWSESELPAK